MFIARLRIKTDVFLSILVNRCIEVLTKIVFRYLLKGPTLPNVHQKTLKTHPLRPTSRL